MSRQSAIIDNRQLTRPLPTFPRAACREHPEIDWIPDRIANPSAMVDRAREVCAECAELLPCLMHAVRARERGIWGGTTDAERRATCQRGGDRCM